MRPTEYDNVRYLESKRSVDDRALHRGVLDALSEQIARRPAQRSRVLEIGAGVGNMARRLYERGVLPATHYTVLDRDAASLRVAEQEASQLPDFRFDFVEAELQHYLHSPQARGAHDLCFANAVLDLVDVPSFLSALWSALPPDGLLWSSVNFDGETILLPELALDAEVMTLYHRSMDERLIDGRPAGDSRCGRHLLEHLRLGGASVLAAGASDWVVWPTARAYPQDEAYFLHHIVHTIDRELSGHAKLDMASFRQWVETRHRQIECGELSYIAHQLDVLARAPGASG